MSFYEALVGYRNRMLHADGVGEGLMLSSPSLTYKCTRARRSAREEK